MRELVFKQKKWWESQWDMYRGEEIVGSLTINAWSYSKATILIGTETWEIGYTGWAGTKLYVRDPYGMRYESEPGKWFSNDTHIRIGAYRYALLTNWWHTRIFAQDESRTTIVELVFNWWGTVTHASTQTPDDKTTRLLALILLYRYHIVQSNGSTATVVSAAS